MAPTTKRHNNQPKKKRQLTNGKYLRGRSVAALITGLGVVDRVFFVLLLVGMLKITFCFLANLRNSTNLIDSLA